MKQFIIFSVILVCVAGTFSANDYACPPGTRFDSIALECRVPVNPKDRCTNGLKINKATGNCVLPSRMTFCPPGFKNEEGELCTPKVEKIEECSPGHYFVRGSCRPIPTCPTGYIFKYGTCYEEKDDEEQ